MRTIHGIKGAQGLDQLLLLRIRPGVDFGELHDLVGQGAAGAMLGQQGVHETGQLAGLFEAGKQIVLFLFFMIVFDEAADDAGGIGQRLGRKGSAGCEAASAYLRKNVSHNSTFVSLTLPGPEVILGH
jgi:hypothetical protein